MIKLSKPIDSAIIESICRILGELTSGYKITIMFQNLNFYDHDIITAGKPISTKWKRLRDAIIQECNNKKSAKPFFHVIEYIMKPIDFVKDSDAWRINKNDINIYLLFYGFELTDTGKVIQTTSVETVNDAHKRLLSFQNKLDMYEIHPHVLEFCKEELFHKNYFHAILEASKSVFQRVRDISELELDGSKLIHQALSTKQPVILIKGNMLKSETERSTYNGLKNLIETIISLYRNPTAHSPKLYDETSETDAITAFTLMSLAHRILDNCFNVRDLDKS